MNSVATLVDLLRDRARHRPQDVAYTFLADGEAAASSSTFGQVDVQARAVAARLQSQARPGQRALLLYPPGLDYAAAFWGCLYAGVVAVPVYPPRTGRNSLRIQSVAADAEASLVLTTGQIAQGQQQRMRMAPALADSRWLATDVPGITAGADDWRPPDLDSGNLAYLQYTSGSTRAPRGVMLSHANVLHNLSVLQCSLQATPDSVGVSWLPPYHDMGLIGGLLLPVFAGTSVVLMPPTAFVEQPRRWLQAIARYRATISGGPNFAFQLCADRITPAERDQLDLSCWRMATCGSEPVRAVTLQRFADFFAPCGFVDSAFHPGYGLAEATLMVSGRREAAPPAVRHFRRAALEQDRAEAHEPPSDGDVALVGCGSALLDQRIEIVTPGASTRCAPGQVGEIWVNSPSVGLGYWNKPDETRETFQARLADTGDGPFLRTGDMGFFQDGQLFIAGRLRDLIILRGLKYYPDDIERTAGKSHLALQPGGGCAFTVPAGGEEHLVIVHELRRSARRADAGEVAATIRDAVGAEQELPVLDVVLVPPGQVPRTSSGKVQRGACRAQYLAGALEPAGRSRLPGEGAASVGAASVGAASAADSAADSAAAPLAQTPLEKHIARIWCDVLGAPVDPGANFYRLGGNSLTLAQVSARLSDELRVDVPWSDLFAEPTVAGMARLVEGQQRRGPAPAAPPVPAARGRLIPLSFSQERMWFVQQLQPSTAAYNVVSQFRLSGPLDVEALERSVDLLVRRHEALRTSFAVVDGQPAQVIAPSLPVEVTRVNLEALPGEARLACLRERIAQDAQRPFDLRQAPLFRFLLFRLEPNEHVVLVNLHHAICDAWSFRVIAREIPALYNACLAGETADLPDLPLQYADYAIWEREWLQGERLQSQLAYWRARLADLPALELPIDRRKSSERVFEGASLTEPLDEDLLGQLKRLGYAENATAYMVLLAAFAVLLHRYSGQEDLAIGTPVANRCWLAVEGLIGTFVNTLVMRIPLSSDLGFRGLLARVREVALGAYAHQDLPFDRLVADLKPARALGQSPLIRAMFNVLNLPLPELRMGGLCITAIEADRHATQFDLSFTVTDTDLLRAITIEYDTALFDPGAIARMMSQYKTLLQGIVADPDRPIGELPVLAAAERRRLLVDWNEARADWPLDQCAHALVEAQARRTPDAVAVAGRSIRLGAQAEVRYGELDRWSSRLARRLRSLGVGPGVRVGIATERCVEMVVGLLGILKAGGAYVPLDPAFPRQRLAFMLEDCGAPVLLTQRSLAADLPRHTARVVNLDEDWEAVAGPGDAPPEGTSPEGASPDQPAYVLYTSGSTGKPKGVLIPHRALVNFLLSMQRQPGLQPQDTLLAITTLSFDIAGLELYLPLITGARVVIASREEATDGALLLKALDRSGATVMQATPATWRMLLDSGWRGSPGLTVLCGGEALPPELADRLLARSKAVWNLYGPTETTVWSTAHCVRPGDTAAGVAVTLGRPIANTRVYILDRRRQPVPIGIPGNLHIGGAGLAIGYLNRPELTADRFVPDAFSPEPGARMYRTDDLARFTPDGRIEYLGRLDDQVKVRGFRIELGEIETVLGQHPGVRQAVVVSREDRPGDRRLVAYLVPHPGQPPAAEGLRALLRESLPDYMIPSAFVALPALPLTPNGKVDRRSLPAPATAPATATARHEPGQPAARSYTRTEAWLVALWQALLGVQPVGVADDFFALGGHSLLAVRLFDAIEAQFHLRLPLATLFERPTIEHLAAAIEARPDQSAWPSLVPFQTTGTRPPLYFVHPLAGDVVEYRSWARLLGAGQPFYGLRAQGLDGIQPPLERIEDMAARYLDEICLIQPTGPYHLAGFCVGGVIAYEMACQLRRRNQSVSFLGIVNGAAPGSDYYSLTWRPGATGAFLRNLPYWLNDFVRLGRSEIAGRLRTRQVLAQASLAAWMSGGRSNFDAFSEHAVARLMTVPTSQMPQAQRDRMQRYLQAFSKALDNYRPPAYDGQVTVFRTQRQPLLCSFDPAMGWDRLAAGGAAVRVIPGSSSTILRPPHAGEFVTRLRDGLGAAGGG